MNEHEREKHNARMLTVAKLRVIVEHGELRFAPAVHVRREVRPDRRYCWDRWSAPRA